MMGLIFELQEVRVEHGYGENRGMYATVLQVQVAVRGSQTVNTPHL